MSYGIREPQVRAGARSCLDWQLSGAQCADVVRAGLDLGYRHIDTAQAYNNEEEVGVALANSGVARDDIFPTTKVWYEHDRSRRSSALGR